jgi:hypothetical protein
LRGFGGPIEVTQTPMTTDDAALAQLQGYVGAGSLSQAIGLVNSAGCSVLRRIPAWTLPQPLKGVVEVAQRRCG